MKAIWVALALLLAHPAAAQTVQVSSGEYDGFSRLVLEIGENARWTVNRTADGYAVRISGRSQFDVSKVFKQLTENRLGAIWADPQDGTLALRVNCACHALPYELVPGTIVIDLRDGPAPEGSSFEQLANGQTAAPLQDQKRIRPKPRSIPLPAETVVATSDAAPANETGPESALQPGYDWTAPMLGQPVSLQSEPGQQIPDAQTAQRTADLREDLYRQLGEGASVGVVEIEPAQRADHATKLATTTEEKAIADAEPAQVRIGQDLGLIAVPGGKEGARDHLSLSGETCPTDEELAVADWGSDQPVSLALPQMRGAVMGELDRVQPEALNMAIRYHLYLGFGAEARQMIAAFGGTGPEMDRFRAMSWAVDGLADPQASLAPMASCKTAAALWAALSASRLQDLPDLNHGAVVLAFGQLPPHLRQALGPNLVRQYVEMGQIEPARQINEAIERGVEKADAASALAGAQVDLALGDTQAAAHSIDAVASANSAVAPQALIDLVNLRYSQGQRVEDSHLSALDALAQEYRADRLGLDLKKAQAIGLATAHRFDEAFALQTALREDLPQVWHLLAKEGKDAAILTHAATDTARAQDLRQRLAWSDRRLLAARLADLGLPDLALNWLDESRLPDNDPVATQLLRARIQAERFDASAVLAELSGMQNDEASRMRADAMLTLDQNAEASLQFAGLGDTAGTRLAARWSGDWSALAADPADAWNNQAGLAQDFAPDKDLGPLEQSRQRIAESEAARTALAQLLDQTAISE